MKTIRLSADAVRPLRTLDPAAALDDLGWLDEAVGDARVVAIGESAHYNREFYELRHRLLRYLAERHGFAAYAMETGFAESWAVDDWVRGGGGDLGWILANGITSLMGMWTPMRDQLEWMRRRHERAGFAFYGIDLPGSMVSPLPGLDAVLGYLAEADPELRPGAAPRETAAAFAGTSAFAAPQVMGAYAELAEEARDAYTAGLADLAARLRARRREFQARTGPGTYGRAARTLETTIALDLVVRALARGDQETAMNERDAAIADTVGWILEREERVVLAAHNGHVQRGPLALPGVPAMVPMGAHLAERLGDGYVAIGTTSGTGAILNTGPDFYTGTLFAELPPPEPGSLDALMDDSHDGPFAADLRRLSAADAAAVRAARRHRGLADLYGEQDPLESFDLLVHLPRVTAAAPDPDAVAHAPEDVRRAFTAWLSR
ncbi:erythromycin esterase family protein [Bailinhaonella thermotolerans]|uniref:Erythromycin esterase family protein n=1 Tax=Bailinhaonella thermotolerans TaxID=1070861 RepID=A0A3A4B7S2_9ACTN|nr:erythromycin esterase family protein [Bailinhaonella thermotolerans]RJL30168.1 erythromycin esterase family protein [Bailinhaonella thermotolerans]